MKCYEIMSKIPDIMIFNSRIQKILRDLTNQEFEIFLGEVPLSEDPFMNSILFCIKNDNIYVEELINITSLSNDKILIQESLINLLIDTLKNKRPNLFI